MILPRRGAVPVADLETRLQQDGLVPQGQRPGWPLPLDPPSTVTALRPPAGAPAWPSRWGVTGAAGWLGRHAVRRLLRQPGNLQVITPVRAVSDAQAQARVMAALTPTPALQAEARRDHWATRVEAWALDDLASPDWWTHRNQPLDAVLHVAADMSLAKTAEQLWASNVVATNRVAQWAEASGARRLDHVSTLSVWVAGNTPAGTCQELDDPRRAHALWGGYGQTKWAAERVVEAWAARWAAEDARDPRSASPREVALHRLGLLVRSQDEGACPTDPVYVTALAVQRWGWPTADVSRIRPQDAFDWSPPDRVLDGLLRAVEAHATGPFHWAGETPIPAAAWHTALRTVLGDRVNDWPLDDPLAKAARRGWARWLTPERHPAAWWMDVFQSDRHRYGMARAQALGVQRWSGHAGPSELEDRVRRVLDSTA